VELAGGPFETNGDTTGVQAVAPNGCDSQGVSARGDLDGGRFDAGQVGEDDVLVGELADVDRRRPGRVAGGGCWRQERLVDDFGLRSSSSPHGSCHRVAVAVSYVGVVGVSRCSSVERALVRAPA